MENPESRRKRRRWPPRVKRRGTAAAAPIPPKTDHRPGPASEDDAATPR